MWWPEYHRGQAVTLLNLAQLTSNPDTASSLMRLAAQHEEMADRAESQRPGEAGSERGVVACDLVWSSAMRTPHREFEGTKPPQHLAASQD